jgi:hypothetical protein
LALLAAGCSSSSDRSVLMSGIRPGAHGKIQLIGPKAAVREATNARGYWVRSLEKAAHSSPGPRFSSPSRAVLLSRLRAQARAHKFEIVAVRMLKPRQLAPLIIVRTTHYVSLAQATPEILRGIDPNWRDRWDYEGIYFEARDERNVPFFAAYNSVRGQLEGGEWARGEALYPFPHG